MIFRNSLAVTAAYVSGYVFSFVLAPIMLARLGLAQFGVWAVAGTFIIFAGLADLGITRALGRFVAFYDARGDRKAVEQCFGLGLIVITAVGLIGLALAVLMAPLASDALDDVLTPDEMRTVLLCIAGLFTFTAYRAVMRSVPEGMQRMVPPNVAEIVAAAINFAFSVAALALSTDLVVYALANLAASVIGLVPGFVALHHVFAPVRARLPSRALVKEILAFSLQSQLAWISELVNNQTDKIILAVFIDVRVAGAYEIASRAAIAVRAVALLSMSGMFPAATQRIAREGTRVIGEFFRHYTARAMSVTFPFVIFACVSAPALLVAWLGEVPENATGVFVALTLANAVNLSTGVAFTLVMGEGKGGMIARVALITMAINLVLTLILGPLFGLWGVVAGTLVAIAGGAAVFLFYFHRDQGLPLMDYVRAVRLPLGLATLAAAPIVVWLIARGVNFDGRREAAIASVVFAVVYFGLYWTVAVRFDLLPERLRLRRRERVA